MPRFERKHLQTPLKTKIKATQQHIIMNSWNYNSNNIHDGLVRVKLTNHYLSHTNTSYDIRIH